MWKIFRKHDGRLSCDELYRLTVYYEKLSQSQGDLSALTKKQAEDLGRLLRKRNEELERHEATQSRPV